MLKKTLKMAQLVKYQNSNSRPAVMGLCCPFPGWTQCIAHRGKCNNSFIGGEFTEQSALEATESVTPLVGEHIYLFTPG